MKKLINAKSEACKKWRRGLITRAENNAIKNRINAQVNHAKTKYYSESLQVYRIIYYTSLYLAAGGLVVGGRVIGLLHCSGVAGSGLGQAVCYQCVTVISGYS